MVGPTFSHNYTRYKGEVKCQLTNKPLPSGTEIKWESGGCCGPIIPTGFEVYCPIHKKYEDLEYDDIRYMRVKNVY